MATESLAGKALLPAFLAVLQLTLAGVRPNQTASDRSEQKASIERVVRALGNGGEDVRRMKTLSRVLAESARLLIAELHPISAVRILNTDGGPKSKDARHVLWCLRALRYMTGGLDFRANTRHHFDNGKIEERRKRVIGGDEFGKDGTVAFFGVWMSRDSVYIAPRDAQVKIINRWKDWYNKRGKTFRYINPNQSLPVDDWYF